MTMAENERPDANKTHLTRIVTASAMLWLFERGFKPLASEVPVCEGWVADVAGAAVLTPSEAVKLKIIRKRPSARIKADIGSPKWNQEWDEHREEAAQWKNDFANLTAPLTCVVEVKTSKADFHKDAARKFKRRPANFCYLAMPPGMVDEDHYPAGWGILACKSECVRVVRHAPLEIQIPAHERAFLIWNIGVRIDHEKRYERMRVVRKEQTDRYAHNRFRGKVSDISYCIRDLLAGKEALGLLAMPEEAKKAITDCVDNLRKRSVAVNAGFVASNAAIKEPSS